jgi:hypothetical protein
MTGSAQAAADAGASSADATAATTSHGAVCSPATSPAVTTFTDAAPTVLEMSSKARERVNPL